MTDRGCILVIDDDPRNLSRIETALAPLGCATHTAGNGADGLCALSRLSGRDGFPGIVISDLKMPIMDGLEFLRSAQDADGDLPVILITAFGDVASAVQAMKSGAYDFVEKPFDPDLLRARALRALEKRRLVIENRRLKAEMAKRRLAAILAADVVGYSRLMEQNEAGALRAINSVRELLIDPKIAEQMGRTVKLMGDGILVEFSSAINAVNCAIGIQTRLAQADPVSATFPQITFRIGVNIGDIIVERDDIFGEGVNIAARLEALAVPGGVCLSNKVHEETVGKVDAQFVDGGLQRLKNISRPIRIWQWSTDG